MRTFSDVPAGHCFFLRGKGAQECYFRLRVDTPSSGASKENELNAVSFQDARLVHIAPDEFVVSITNTEDFLAAVRMMENGSRFLARVDAIPHASGEFAVSGRSG